MRYVGCRCTLHAASLGLENQLVVVHLTLGSVMPGARCSTHPFRKNPAVPEIKQGTAKTSRLDRDLLPGVDPCARCIVFLLAMGASCPMYLFVLPRGGGV